MDERDEVGGVANAAYDACYHQLCDSIDNVNFEVLLEMAQACAAVTYNLAMQADLTTFLAGGTPY